MMTEIEVVKQAIKNVDKKALLQVKIIFAYTVTRPHAGLCHHDRMVLDQMVRGRNILPLP
jgi:hypothetical protein